MDACDRIEDLPPFVGVEQAAAVLGISRTSAYSLARRWERTNGNEGLPVVRLGRTLRVPAAALARMADIDLPSTPRR